MPIDVISARTPVRVSSTPSPPTVGKPFASGCSASQLRNRRPHSLRSTCSILRRAITGYQKLS